MSDYSTIGKTVMDYNENCRNIACLKKQLFDIGSHLELLGQKLQNQPNSVTVSSGAVRVSQMHQFVIEEHPTVIPPTDLDPDTLRTLLTSLEKALTAHHQLNNSLRGMGLSESIREL